MKIILKCFHEEPFKAYVMEELPYLETHSITYRCPECGKEVILEMVFEEAEGS